jgi:anti-anti-sigma factor
MTTIDAGRAERFRLELEPDRARVRVRPIGPLDAVAAAELEAECDGLLERGFDAIVLDLSATTALSPAAVGVIAAVQRHAHRQAALLTVVPGNELTTGVLRRSGLLAQLMVAGGPTTFFEWSQ